MAIAYEGTDGYESTSGASQTNSMTVPTGSDCVVVCLTGWGNFADLWPLTTGTFGGVTLVAQAGGNDSGAGAAFSAYGTSFEHVAIFTAVSESWGATEDLVIDLAATPSEGLRGQVLFFSGVDQTTPVNDSADANGNITGLTTSAGMFTVGVGAGSGATPACSGSGQTQVISNIFNNSGYCMGYEANSTTFDVTNQSSPGIAALVLVNAPEAGGSTSLTLLGVG